MYTSYFAKSGKLEQAISIAKFKPRWLPTIHEYPPLFPPYDLLERYNKGKRGLGPIVTEEQYTREYQARVLASLDVYRVLEELGEDAILCCYEKSGTFCHRHIVAEWLHEATGISITEL